MYDEKIQSPNTRSFNIFKMPGHLALRKIPGGAQHCNSIDPISGLSRYVVSTLRHRLDIHSILFYYQSFSGSVPMSQQYRFEPVNFR